MSWTRFFGRRRRDDEFRREIASYIAIETDDNLARGMSPAEAHDAAVRKFGNVTLAREEIHLMNTIVPLDLLWQDVTHAGRLLRRDKGFAVAAILSLALGIGANAAIFQLLDAVRLRALPVRDPQQLVEIRIPPGTSRWGSFSNRRAMLTSAQFEQIRAQETIFDGLFAWSSGQLNTATGGDVAYAEALWAGGELFTVLGVRPMLGRPLLPEDDRKGCGAPPAVISHAYWQRAFGGSPAVLGQTVRLEGHQFPIVGVAPPDFFGLDVGRRFDVAVPLCADPLLTTSNRAESLTGWWLSAIGRLRPGVTRQQATDHLIAISPAVMRATLPPGNTAEGDREYLAHRLNAFAADSGVSSLRTQFGQPLVVLLAATGLVLLIACANLANLLLARASARSRELAVRLAIGASRARIARQLLVESVLLACAGTALGMVMASGLTRVLLSQLSAGAGTTFVDVRWNGPALAFTAAVSLVACVLFGLAPALKATALTPAVALKAGGRGTTEGRESFGVRRLLVVTQVALSLVLLLGALLFTRTLYNVLTIDAGFDQRVIFASLAHRSLISDDPARGQASRTQLQEAIAALPDVAGTAIADYVPLAGNSWNEHVFVDHGTEKALSNFTRVSADYFALLGIPLVRGRTFGNADTQQAPPVAVVNEAFVGRLLSGVDPIGRLLWVETGPDQPVRKVEIVGVVRNTKYQDIREDFQPLVHLAASQSTEFDDEVRLVVKPRGNADAVMPSIARAVATVNPAINVQTRTISQSVSGGLVRERLMAALSAAFGALAALLAAVGLYGVMSYSVTRRANEIGIRLAMGAHRFEVLRLVIVEAGVLVGVGLGIGVALGLGAANAGRSLLFGLQPTDPTTIACAVVLLASIGLAAAYVPARRASKLDPASVLRTE